MRGTQTGRREREWDEAWPWMRSVEPQAKGKDLGYL